MYHTIQLSSCVSVQGTFVERLDNGDVVISDGQRTWRGTPISRIDTSHLGGSARRSQDCRA